MTAVEGKQETDETNISVLQATTTTHTSEIESLDSRVTQNETDISSVTSRVEGFLDSEVSQEGINNLNVGDTISWGTTINSNANSNSNESLIAVFISTLKSNHELL